MFSHSPVHYVHRPSSHSHLGLHPIRPPLSSLACLSVTISAIVASHFRHAPVGDLRAALLHHSLRSPGLRPICFFRCAAMSWYFRPFSSSPTGPSASRSLPSSARSADPRESRVFLTSSTTDLHCHLRQLRQDLRLRLRLRGPSSWSSAALLHGFLSGSFLGRLRPSGSSINSPPIVCASSSFTVFFAHVHPSGPRWADVDFNLQCHIQVGQDRSQRRCTSDITS